MPSAYLAAETLREAIQRLGAPASQLGLFAADLADAIRARGAGGAT